MEREASPWSKLDKVAWDGKPVWCSIETRKRVACDDFWQYFDWLPPKPGQEMRLVFSRSPVNGAQRTLVSAMAKKQAFLLPSHDMGMYSVLTVLLKRLEPEHEQFYVWWWPEYREGEI